MDNLLNQILNIDSSLSISTFNSTISVLNPTNATSTTSGSINTAGGLGVSKDLVLGGSLILNTLGSVINMNNNSIINLASPVNPNDAATKAYVDSVGSGI